MPLSRELNLFISHLHRPHFANRAHAELLLEYGANPFLTNEYGQDAFRMLPKDMTPSTKVFFKRIFAKAMDRMPRELPVSLFSSVFVSFVLISL
jgi:hypothetical protein